MIKINYVVKIRLMFKAFLRVRLSYYFAILFVFFVGLLMVVPKPEISDAMLTLLSINSFLFGFYFNPALDNQKSRVEELGRIMRSESVALFKILVDTRKLSDRKTHDRVQGLIGDYIKAKLAEKKLGAGEAQYEKIIGELVHFDRKNKEIGEIDSILEALADNQSNRTDFDMMMGRKIYSNEWYVLLTLFTVTLSLPIIVDFGSNPILHIIASMLCATLVLLLITLLKINSLVHKKAKGIWDPMQSLLDSDFRKVDDVDNA